MRRIAALHAEIDEIVARHVDAVAKECGSIPEGVIKQIEVDAFGRVGFCHCKAARFLLAEGNASRRRGSSVEEDSTRRVVD
jgi:hypothetical protein